MLVRLVLCLLLAAGGCGKASPSQPDPHDDGPLTVAVTIQPHGWLVERVAGDLARAVVIVPPGASPATYAPTDAQVTDVLRASIYFRTGVPLENGPWMSGLRRAGTLRIVDLRNGITMRELPAHTHGQDEHDHGHEHDHEHEHGGAPDPHIWLDPLLLERQARTIADALIERRPARADEINARVADLAAELGALDETLRSMLATCGADTLLVFHPAWGYFTDRYGLRQISIEVGGQTPSDAELTEIRRQAQDAGSTIVFVQPQIKGNAAEAVARSLGGEVRIIDPLAVPVDANLLAVARELCTDRAASPAPSRP